MFLHPNSQHICKNIIAVQLSNFLKFTGHVKLQSHMTAHIFPRKSCNRQIVCPSGHTILWIYDLICSRDLLFSDFVKNLYLSNRKKKITIKDYNYSLTILSHSVGLVVILC